MVVVNIDRGRRVKTAMSVVFNDFRFADLKRCKIQNFSTDTFYRDGQQQQLLLFCT